MRIGIVLGAVLGAILLCIGGIAYFVTRKRKEKCKWSPWMALVGVCALITAAVNALLYLR